MTIHPPFPSVLDSSLIAAARSCPQKAYLEFFHHWKGREPSVHLHAGAAYAAGLEGARRAFFQNGQSKEDSEAIGIQKLMEFYGDFECPMDSAKSLERTAGALEFYFDRYQLDEDQAKPIQLAGGICGVELNFNEPIDLDDPEMHHPQTGDPLFYCGRADMVASYQGMTLGVDDKTTSQLGASWPRQWDLRSQFTGYSWGFGRMGLKLDGWLVRGVAILKTTYNTMEAITYRPQWQIDRWFIQLKRDIINLKKMWAAGYFDFNLDHACAEYGGCPFRNVCLMKDPTALLETSFERRRWDPVRRVEVPIQISEEGDFIELEVVRRG